MFDFPIFFLFFFKVVFWNFSINKHLELNQNDSKTITSLKKILKTKFNDTIKIDVYHVIAMLLDPFLKNKIAVMIHGNSELEFNAKSILKNLMQENIPETKKNKRS